MNTELVTCTDALAYASLKSNPCKWIISQSVEVCVKKYTLSNRLTLYTHTAHGWLVAKGLCCVFKKKDNQERAWKAERHGERKKKERVRERTKCTKRKTDGIWVPHGESTRTPQRKTLHLPFLCLNHSNSFILSFILFFVSQRERARVRRTRGTNTPQKCYGKDGRDDNENFVMIYSPLSFFLPRKKQNF